MIPDLSNTDSRGQVGIGTLIIFIALVLVAAVAAGVLVNTSGELQSQAADTGSDAQSEVSNQIDVLSATGEVTGSDPYNVTKLTFEVKKSAGADPIDLSAATIQFVSDSSAQTLEVGSGASISGTSVLASTSNRATIEVTLNPGSEPYELKSGGEAEVTFIDQSGASTVYGVNVPEVTTGKDYVSV